MPPTNPPSDPADPSAPAPRSASRITRSSAAQIAESTTSLRAARDSAHGEVDRCSVCGKQALCRPIDTLRPAIVEQIKEHHPDFDTTAPAASVCTACLSTALSRHTLATVKRKRSELPEVEKEIAARATAIADEIENGVPATAGQHAADAVARVGGSWGFVLGFCSLLVAWAVINGVLLADAFDPFPFILLNLVLSCIAAIQAPIILMSQSRMSQIDRIRATEDLRINLKAELEVAALHEKVDHLIHQQWDRMLELQEVQLAILEELRGESGQRQAAAAADASSTP